MTVDELLGRLDRVKRNGSGWVARCPAHEDRNPSLSVGEGGGGRILLNCQAGCEPAAVVGALGLTLADLFTEPANGNGRREIVEAYQYGTRRASCSSRLSGFCRRGSRSGGPTCRPLRSGTSAASAGCSTT